MGDAKLNVIGLSGKAGAGKDTAADYLVKRHGFVKIGLADPMKRFCKEIFGFTDEQLWGPSEKRNAPDERFTRKQIAIDGHTGHPIGYTYPALTPRYALQKLGTEWGRDCYRDVWIDYALRVAREVLIAGAQYLADEWPNCSYWAGPRDPNRPRGVVISDTRFVNEILAVKAVGGRVWRIRRNAAPLDGFATSHASETEQDALPDRHFDQVIENDSSIGELHRRICEALGESQ